MDGASLLRLLSEPTRHALLARLRDDDATVAELTTAVGHEQSNVSHHLRLLRDAGIVRSRPWGRQRVYGIADPELARLLADVDALAARIDRVAYVTNLQLPFDRAFHGYG